MISVSRGPVNYCMPSLKTKMTPAKTLKSESAVHQPDTSPKHKTLIQSTTDMVAVSRDARVKHNAIRQREKTERKKDREQRKARESKVGLELELARIEHAQLEAEHQRAHAHAPVVGPGHGWVPPPQSDPALQ